MRKVIVVIGLIILVLGCFWIWSINEDRTELNRTINSWQFIFLPAETQLALYSQLEMLDNYMFIAITTILGGIVTTIIGVVINSKKEIRAYQYSI